MALSPAGVQALGRDHFLEMSHLGVGEGLREMVWNQGPVFPFLSPPAKPRWGLGASSWELPDSARGWNRVESRGCCSGPGTQSRHLVNR